MNLEQAMSEARATRRRPRRPAKVIAEQFEMKFPSEPFRLIAEALPPEEVSSRFAELRSALCENTDSPSLFPL